MHTYITGSFSVFPGGSRATGDWGYVRGEGRRGRGGGGHWRGISPHASAREGTEGGGEGGGGNTETDKQGQGGAESRGARGQLLLVGQAAAAQAIFLKSLSYELKQ